MIDPKELHVGAHVDYEGKRLIVAAISGSDVSLIKSSTPIAIYKDVWCGYIEPIPITEELLAELGFEKREMPTYPNPTIIYVDAEYAKLRAEGKKLVVPRITIQYINVTNPFWSVSAYGENMEDSKADVRYLHELEAFLYLTTKTELIKE